MSFSDVHNESTFLGHEACPKCGSENNLGVYSDGHAHCFGAGCGYYRRANSEGIVVEEKTRRTAKGLIRYTFPEEALFRGNGPVGLIDPETCRRGMYGLGKWTMHGKEVNCHVANYVDRDRRIVSQKIRLPGKGVGYDEKFPDMACFPWAGNTKQAMPYGFHLFQKGKRLLVVEGEKDWLAAMQIQKNEWPVWSVINGAASCAKDLLKAGDYLAQFEEVVLMLDSDEPGRLATEAAAKELIGNFNIKVAPPLPLKDVFDMLAAGRAQEVIKAIWNAARYRPRTIVTALELIPRIHARTKGLSVPYHWKGLNETLGGAYGNEIVTIVAGSGTGKSTICRSLLHHFHTATDDKVGGLFIEEDTEVTLSDVIGLHKKVNLRVNPEALSKEEIDDTAVELFTDKDLPLIDLSFETVTVDELMGQLRYLAKVEGCKRIVVDHLSFIVASMPAQDERKAIDLAMTKLRGLVKQTGITLFLVVHLKRPDGNKGYDEGLKVSTNFIRGSQSIEQTSDVVIALQRNKRDHVTHNWVEVVVLKNRHNGKDGCTACWLEYDPETGMMTEGNPPTEEEPTEMGDERQPDEKPLPF